MRHTVKRLTALFVALLLALTGVLPVSVFAEDAEDGIVALENGSPEDLIEVPDGVVDMENAPTVGRRGEIPSLELSDDLSLDLLAEDAPQPAPEAVVTYCFIADDAPVATQAAREGDAIQRPADPSAPEGYAFIGWFLEDGAPLFVDADGDGAIDPIIAHPDPLCPQIVVTARFEAAEDDAPQVPSPLGEGGSAEALTDEVVPPAETPDSEETEEETTSSDSPDGEPASAQGHGSAHPEGEAIWGPAEDDTEAPAEQPAEDDTEAPAEQPTEDDTEAPAEQPTEDDTEAPAGQPAEGDDAQKIICSTPTDVQTVDLPV